MNVVCPVRRWVSDNQYDTTHRWQRDSSVFYCVYCLGSLNDPDSWHRDRVNEQKGRAS